MGRISSCFDRTKNNEIKGNFWVKSRKGVIFRNMKGEGFSCERPRARLFPSIFQKVAGKGKKRRKRKGRFYFYDFGFLILDFSTFAFGVQLYEKETKITNQLHTTRTMM